jgi:ubiquitin carboxyl-terminal hydrolase 34
VPQESDICKSLEDLQIHNGLILVKREPEVPTSPRVPQGASPVEVEILNHFDELWEYLSMDEKLAREVRTPEIPLLLKRKN